MDNIWAQKISPVMI